ncbi:MAG: TIGR04053 family radical SAM/SPASM domain-containing protein [Armatimonadota bacterium]|nr:TIGR04053 family radical SAM/SPASM domain-containing protein [Armatimonadota bacterium]MDR7452341.1 TIGR04053 family radical SAM/SPASM domain-containing protein [Armatimonadota bacterium]MDR7466901.1 TIGR04053 family radical SAM/SPASM domain-containing protein [Armatimonadota bacterium]MDR7493557.1 TIGR04053 family radical SAM/SPASM domain-containing protein [Armatimonadota bacterium]MDR7498822.1 TIGR04053 family radical SAM/SPASM domain-containing protein [Armatimonadota bacterium]
MRTATAAVSAGAGYRFDRAPRMIYWEMTRACDLACRHCRAEAVAQRDPLELTTDEAVALLRTLLDFGHPLPHLVCTGGDPLKRPDLLEIVRTGTAMGLGVSLAPSATASLTREMIVALQAAGMQSISLSLDGSTAARHDRFRGVEGTFETTLRAARWIRQAEIPLQLNTLVTAETAPDLPALYDLACSLGIMRWSLFFLVPVGRGRTLPELTPEQAEDVMRWLAARSAEAPFAIAATEAPHFRRVALAEAQARGLTAQAVRQGPIGRGFGVRDGNGVMFISHRGDVTPAGFLPVITGNVRDRSVVELYRSHEVFVALRDPARLRGKCGVCEFRELCGGSRARAFAHFGDYLASDPLCAYIPRGWRDEVPAPI